MFPKNSFFKPSAWLWLLLCASAFACNKNKKAPDADFTKAFYYWQTNLNNYSFNDSTYKSLGVSKLYIRLFDVDWDESLQKPVPVSPLQAYYNEAFDSTTIVPVVFITNQTFTHLNEAQSRELAHKVHKKVMSQITRFIYGSWYSTDEYDYSDYEPEEEPYRHKAKAFNDQAKKDSVYQARIKYYPEIQFDCDWTPSTRNKYFAFLTEYKKLTATTISSTIRLYQYKYPDKAGVPPVSRGMLMCYNAGNIKDARTSNSLFDKKEVLSYVESAGKYPLPMDYALPIFSWGVLFQNGEFKDILDMKDLAKYAQYLSIKDSAYYQDNRPAQIVKVTEDFVMGDYYDAPYLRKGDQIRIEKSDMNEVISLARLLSKRKESGSTLSLFHLNEYYIKHHAPAIKMVYGSF